MGFWSGIRNKLKKDEGPDEKKEYAEFLVKEMETLKAATNDVIQRDRQTIQELELKIEQLSGKVEKESEKIIGDAKAEAEHIRSDAKAEAEDIRSDAKAEAENIRNDAKEEAEDIRNDAKEEAEDIRREAKVELQIYRKKLQDEARESLEAERKNFYAAKKQMILCLDTLNNFQTRLLGAQEELDRLMRELPLQIGELFPGENLDFLLKNEKFPEDEETVVVYTKESRR